VLKNPPLNQVHFGVGFPSNLAVADARHSFYELVRHDFPDVRMPELSKISYDFGDYVLRSENAASRLEIGMNYFRLVTTSYAGYSKLKQQFSDVLFKFGRCYRIESYTQLSMTYFNELQLGDAQQFESYFSIQIRIPQITEPIFAGRGVMVFEERDGHVTLEIDPQFKDNLLTSYGFIIGFAAQKVLTLGETKDNINSLLDSGHSHVKRYFLSTVNQSYLTYLEAL
jgi:uncharacterized protein (TIGR04255 family)